MARVFFLNADIFRVEVGRAHGGLRPRGGRAGPRAAAEVRLPAPERRRRHDPAPPGPRALGEGASNIQQNF